MCGNQIHYLPDVCLPFHSQKLKDRMNNVALTLSLPLFKVQIVVQFCMQIHKLISHTTARTLGLATCHARTHALTHALMSFFYLSDKSDKFA